jgi:hypothetical protein
MRKDPVKKNMDKLHKPSTHRDKTKYYRNSEVDWYSMSISQELQEDLEPITIHPTEHKPALHPTEHKPALHPTEHDESDDIEDAKKAEEDLAGYINQD